MSDFVKLSEVAKINPRPPKDIDEAQVVTFLPMAAVSEDGYVSYEEQRIYSEVKKGFTYFERGDFIIAKITPCFENGKAALTCNIERPIGFGSTEFHVVSPIPHKLDKNYLYHLLWSDQFRFYGEKEMRGAAGQKRISTDFLKEYKIPLPLLEEQKRIAAMLDKADAIRRKRKQAIDLTNQLLRSIFLDMFGDPVTNSKGWETIPLDEIADIKSGITKGRKVKGQVLTKVPYMRVANVQDGHIKLDDIATIAITEDEQERYKLVKNDILLTEGGDPDKLGRGTVWKAEVEPCVHQNHIFRVRIKNNSAYTPSYLSTLIGSKYGKRYFLRAAKQTTGIATINKTQLREFPVLVPPFELQKNSKHIWKNSSHTRNNMKNY